MIVIAAAATVIEIATAGTVTGATAIAGIATAIGTRGATVREIRAETVARAAIIRVQTIAAVNPSAARTRLETRLLARIPHLVRLKKERRGPTNLCAQTHLAARASDPPTSAASAVSEEDAAVGDAAAADAMAARTLPVEQPMPRVRATLI
jgi:hypothetical protein